MEFLHVLLHALLDTLNVFAVVLILYILFSFIEGKIINKITKDNKFSPIIGASIGLIPQCGFSIVSADLYTKKYISLGTLIAVFIACSDEAIPVLLSHPNKILSILPLLICKFIVAIIFGYIIDIIYKKQTLKKHKHEHEKLIHSGCCHHEIEQTHETKIKRHLVHPLIHSLKISIYVLIVNIIFALIIHFVGENTIASFLNSNVYLTPLLASLVGLIPNCASSVIISELFAANSLTFAATLAGLICNAGLGLILLFKNKNNIKNALMVIGVLFAISLFIGYSFLLIELFVL